MASAAQTETCRPARHHLHGPGTMFFCFCEGMPSWRCHINKRLLQVCGAARNAQGFREGFVACKASLASLAPESCDGRLHGYSSATFQDIPGVMATAQDACRILSLLQAGFGTLLVGLTPAQSYRPSPDLAYSGRADLCRLMTRRPTGRVMARPDHATIFGF